MPIIEQPMTSSFTEWLKAYAILVACGVFLVFVAAVLIFLVKV